VTLPTTIVSAFSVRANGEAMISSPRSSRKKSNLAFFAVVSVVALIIVGFSAGRTVGALTFLWIWQYYAAVHLLTRYWLKAMIFLSWLIALSDLLTSNRWGVANYLDQFGLAVLLWPLIPFILAGHIPLIVLSGLLGEMSSTFLDYQPGGPLRHGAPATVWACTAIVFTMATFVRRANHRSHGQTNEDNGSEEGESTDSSA
jgi:hypothetical protein